MSFHLIFKFSERKHNQSVNIFNTYIARKKSSYIQCSSLRGLNLVDIFFVCKRYLCEYVTM